MSLLIFTFDAFHDELCPFDAPLESDFFGQFVGEEQGEGECADVVTRADLRNKARRQLHMRELSRVYLITHPKRRQFEN